MGHWLTARFRGLSHPARLSVLASALLVGAILIIINASHGKENPLYATNAQQVVDPTFYCVGSCPTGSPTPTYPLGQPTIPLCTTPSPAPATSGKTYYVATTGSDVNPGTQSQPFRTIQHAADTVQAGDMVMVADGTYNEAVDNKASGTADAHIYFKSQNKWGAKVATSEWRNIINWGDYVDIIDFELSGEAGARSGVLNYASHVNVIGNNIHNLFEYPCEDAAYNGGSGVGDGIDSIPASDNNIIGNVIHDNGGGSGEAFICGNIIGPYGIYKTHSGIVANNIIYNNKGYGIHAWHEPHDLLIANNIMFNKALI